MVILDPGAAASPQAKAMLAASVSNGAGPYINPDDILSPLSHPEMDPKSSPLAMLAKTCSQIGADPGTSIKPSTGKKTASSGTPESHQHHFSNSRNATPTASSESKNKTESPKHHESSSSGGSRSRSSSTEIRVTDTVHSGSKSARKSPLKSDKTPTPTVRSGMEIMGAHPTLRAVPPYSTSSSSLPSNNPFLASFAPSVVDSGVCRDPLCRDPLCPTALRNQQQLLNPYTSLLASPHYREAMLAYQRMAMAMATAPPGSAGGALPYVCNWVAGSDYCGRRFANSEELLVHVKTHTSYSAAAASDPRALLLSSLPTTTASSTPSPRFHPYSRPPGGASSSAAAVAAAAAAAMSSGPSLPPPGSPGSLSLAALASNPYASLYTSLFSRPPLF